MTDSPREPVAMGMAALEVELLELDLVEEALDLVLEVESVAVSVAVAVEPVLVELLTPLLEGTVEKEEGRPLDPMTVGAVGITGCEVVELVVVVVAAVVALVALTSGPTTVTPVV
jgi:hypothetical protein